MRLNPVLALAGLAFAVVLTDAAAAAKIYKWIDERGVTHYGETIPPEYRDQAAVEMTKRGLTVRKWDAATITTPAQRKAVDDKAILEREERQRAFEQRRRDVALVNTYTSVKEIDDARERSVQLPQQAIRGLEPRLRKAQEGLLVAQRQAAEVAKSGKAIPEALEQDAADRKADVDGIKADIERYQTQILAIKAKYESDKRRYLELTPR